MSSAIQNWSSFCCVPLLAQHWLRELKKYDFDLPSIIWQGGYIKWNTPYFARFITVNSCSFTKMAVFESFSKQITQRYVQSYIHTKAPTKVLTLTCFLHEVKVHCVYFISSIIFNMLLNPPKMTKWRTINVSHAKLVSILPPTECCWM